MPYGNSCVDPASRACLDRLHDIILRTVQSISLPDRPGDFLECVRGDIDARPGEIVRGIVEQLVHSEIAIAVLSGHNPNVFYELGVRHAVSNDTILLAEDVNDVPFDLRQQRMILYQADLRDVGEFQEALRQTLVNILRQPGKIDNPVRRFLVDHEQNRLTAQGRPPGFDALSELIKEMAAIRSEMHAQLADMRKALQESLADGPSNAVAECDQFSTLIGAWFNVHSGSYAYGRPVRNTMVFVYCYGGNYRATGIYYGLRKVGDQIFARFRWLENPDICGYALFRVQDGGSMAGGWWFADSVPPDVQSNIASLSTDHPGMVPSLWRRLPEQPAPKWAEEWFQQSERAGAVA